MHISPYDFSFFFAIWLRVRKAYNEKWIFHGYLTIHESSIGYQVPIEYIHAYLSLSLFLLSVGPTENVNCGEYVKFGGLFKSCATNTSFPGASCDRTIH